MIYSLADALHQTKETVMNMTVEEFKGWLLYFDRKNKDDAKDSRRKN